jgi:hypothetical protein
MKFEITSDEETVKVNIVLSADYSKDYEEYDVVLQISKNEGLCTSTYVEIGRLTHDGKFVLHKIEKEDAEEFELQLEKGYIKVEKEKCS